MPATTAKKGKHHIREFKVCYDILPMEVALVLPDVLRLHTGNGEPMTEWRCDNSHGLPWDRDPKNSTCPGHVPEIVTVDLPDTGPVNLVRGRYSLFDGDGFLEFSGGSAPITTVISGEIFATAERRLWDMLTDVKKTALERSPWRRSALRLDVSKSFFSANYCLTFFGVKGATRPVFNRGLEEEIETYILTPLRNREGARRRGCPKRRGVLLAGAYGVGKSMLAKYIASEVNKAGCSFIYAAEGGADLLDLCYRAAQKLQPAVLFVEDIDSAMGTQDRTNSVNAVLNILDGVDTKDDEMVVVFSTNSPNTLNKALLRPGRLDVLVEVTLPDAEAVCRLLTLYGVQGAINEREVVEIVGFPPAAIRELVTRAELRSLYRNEEGGATIELVKAEARRKKVEDELVQRQPEPEGPLPPTLDQSLKEVVKRSVAELWDERQDDG